MFSNEKTREFISKTPVVGFTLFELLVWYCLLFGVIPYSTAVPVIVFLVIIGPAHIYTWQALYNLSKRFKKYLDCKFNSKGLLAEKPEITEWKKGDKLKVKFWISLKNKKGDKVFWKEVPNFQKLETAELRYKGISDPEHLLITDVAGNFHEINHNEFLSIENKTYNERIDKKRQKKLKQKANEGTIFEESIKELENNTEYSKKKIK